jgi:hypothetical protein
MDAPKPPDHPSRFWRDPHDPELLSNLDMSYYVQEVALQCGHARRAWRELHDAIGRRDVSRAYYHVQAFLAAAALISRVLWPGKTQEARRGRDLRAALGVDDSSPLHDRAMRDHFAHFEERLDRFLTEPRDGQVRAFVDLNMYPDGEPEPPTGRLRHIDPQTLVVTVRGDRYELRPVYEALLSLSEQTKRDWWQGVVPPEGLSGGA